MLNEFISLVKHLPELKKIEYAINTKCYWMGSPHSLKEALTNKSIDNPGELISVKILKLSTDLDKMTYIVQSVDILKSIFSKIPLKLQLNHIFNIPRCIDQSSYLEDYKTSSISCESVMLNHLMMTYAEIILPQLEGNKKIDFLANLEKNLRKGGFMGGKFYEEDHLIVLHKWQLENELATNPQKAKKPVKI